MALSWSLDERKVLALHKVRKLRRACRKEKKQSFLGMRDWFMIELGLNTGLRVQEMCDLRHADLRLEKDESSLVVRKGKGRKRRDVLFSGSFKRLCKAFLEWKRKSGLPVDGEGFVICSEHGKKLTKRALQKRFKLCAQQAGIESHYAIHCLRHTYGTHLYKASGNNLRLVQEQLGHASITTTQVYANFFRRDVKQAVEGLYKR